MCELESEREIVVVPLWRLLLPLACILGALSLLAGLAGFLRGLS